MSSKISSQISAEGAEQALEASAGAHIGVVINYHGNVTSCKCERHKSDTIEEDERHSVDVEIQAGDKKEILYSVPCFVYAQGVIDHGFVKDDRVLIQYINGDRTMPVASSYYREVGQLELFWNSFKEKAASVFLDLLPLNWGDGGDSSDDKGSDEDKDKDKDKEGEGKDEKDGEKEKDDEK